MIDPNVVVYIHAGYVGTLLMLIACLFVCFYSARDDYNIDKEAYHSLTITSDGNISRFFPTIYKASCNLDVTNFPFDDQVTFFKENKRKMILSNRS